MCDVCFVTSTHRYKNVNILFGFRGRLLYVIEHQTRQKLLINPYKVFFSLTMMLIICDVTQLVNMCHDLYPIVQYLFVAGI
jgi:hypothetical protein